MKKFAIACLFTASLGSFALFAEEMTGVISDSHCGAAHSTASAAAEKCTAKCLKGGSEPVLVSNGKVMKLDSESQEKAKAFGGQEVKIDGSMEGDTVKISSIEKATK
jgi:hypothetical protein